MQKQQLCKEVALLLENEDYSSLEYLLSDQNAQTIQNIGKDLSVELRQRWNRFMQFFKKEELVEESDGPEERHVRNMEIDKKLNEEYNKKEHQEEEHYLDYLSNLNKINDKLIYEEFFGFPYHHLIKKIFQTHGDSFSNLQATKNMHSQIQIFYSDLFKPSNLEIIYAKPGLFHKNIKTYLEHICKDDYQKYFKFQNVYKHIKKETSERQDEDSDEEEVHPEMHSQAILEIDEKEYFIKYSQKMTGQEFERYNKNKNVNFLCFGLKKYASFLDQEENFLKNVPQKQFCELVSFLSLKFIRRIIFTIIRNRNHGQLQQLTQPITANEVTSVGNQFIDQLQELIHKQLQTPITVEDQAQLIFMEEFLVFRYEDFIPKKYFYQAKKYNQEIAAYVWKHSKEYQYLWINRVKTENIFNKKQPKSHANQEYLQYIQSNQEKFRQNSGSCWKTFIMKKFQCENQKQENSKKCEGKRVKLDSLS